MVGGLQTTNQLVGGLQATNQLVGCLQPTNQLVGGLQITNQLVDGLQTTNQLVGGLVRKSWETFFFTSEVSIGRTELSLRRAISKRCSLSNGHVPRG